MANVAYELLAKTLREKLETMFFTVDDNLHVIPILERMLESPDFDLHRVILTKDSFIYPGDSITYNDKECKYVEMTVDTDGGVHCLMETMDGKMAFTIPIYKLINMENKVLYF